MQKISCQYTVGTPLGHQVTEGLQKKDGLVCIGQYEVNKPDIYRGICQVDGTESSPYPCLGGYDMRYHYQYRRTR